MESSPASAFFLKHKDLFEYDKYVGGGPITASSPSFLDRYQECERLQLAESTAFTAPFAIVTRSFPSPSLSSDTPMMRLPAVRAPEIDFMYGVHCPSGVPQRLPSPSRLAIDTTSSTPFAQPQPPPYRSPSQSPSKSPQRSPKRSASPQRHGSVWSRGVVELPKVSDLLIDGSTRAGLLGVVKRPDDAKKVELLIGSKCVGRLSAAASSNLPPAIRRRLQASALINQRRERLYTALKDEYNRLMG